MTTTIFSGLVLGQEFQRVSADDPFDLCQKVLPGCDPLNLRMFVLFPIQPYGRPYWGDVMVGHSEKVAREYLDQFRQHHGVGADGEVIQVIIRRWGHPGPNSVADFEKYYKLAADELELSRSSSLSNLSDPAGDSEEETRFQPRYFSCSFEALQNVVNDVEPFTQEPITADNASKLTPLGHEEIVLVDLKEFIVHALYKFDQNQTLTEMRLPRVRCRYDETISFQVFREQWEESIFPHSQLLRDRYAQCKQVYLAHKERLQELKYECPRLFATVLFWIQDLRNFDDAKEILTRTMEVPDVPPLMSPAYFTSDQARYLGRIYIDGSQFKTLKEVLVELVETHEKYSKMEGVEHRKERDEFFYGNQLPDKLQEVLSIHPALFMCHDFEEDHKSRLKERLCIYEANKRRDEEQALVEGIDDDSEDDKENIGELSSAAP